MNYLDIKKHIHLASSRKEDFNIIFNTEKEDHQLPICIINGKEKGAVFTIVAGIHGYEYPPIIALQEILNEINPKKLCGTLIILPIANIGAFYQRTPFLHPEDKKNLNKTFPGSPSGSISEQIANYITQNIIPNTDIFIDLHGGDANEDLVPFVCFYDNPKNLENTQKARQLSEISGLPMIVSYPYTISNEEPALYAFKQAVQLGKVSISVEAGKLGNLQSDNVTILKNAIYNILDFSKIYLTEQKIKQKEQKLFTQQVYISSPKKGIFYSELKAGDFVRKGENLGYITDIFGRKLTNITTPTQGIILYKVGTPPINEGETLFCIVS